MLDFEGDCMLPANPLAAAYEVSRLTTRQRVVSSDELSWWMNMGYYPVVAHWPAHCRVTDAYLGWCDQRLHGLYATRAEAEAVCAQISEDTCGEGYGTLS